MSRRSQTLTLLNEYLRQGRPVEIRNEIVMLNERLIGWVAKHYKCDGYAEYDDLKQECVLAAIHWIEDLMTEQTLPYYNIRIFMACCGAADDYRTKQMCTFSQEQNYLRRSKMAFKEYIRQNLDEWSLASLQTFVTMYYEERYQKTELQQPSYFMERTDADEIATIDPEWEIATTEDMAHNIYDVCQLTPHQRMAMDEYLFRYSDLDCYHENCISQQQIFSDLAYERGVSVSAICSNFVNARKTLRENIDAYLMQYKRFWMCNDLVSLTNSSLRLRHLTPKPDPEYYGQYE